MEYDWDDGNRDKNLRHGVHDWEIEEALADPGGVLIETARIEGEERHIFLGRSHSSGMYLRIVFTVRNGGRAAGREANQRCQYVAEGEEALPPRTVMPPNRTSRTRRKIISSLDEIPSSFASEDEERDFWASHEFSDELYDQLQAASGSLDDLLAHARKADVPRQKDRQSRRRPAKSV
jgi:uncharacterized DUF497 family protein